MSTALVPTWRITLPYTASGGLLHKWRMYVKSTGAVVGGVIQLIDRTATSFDWTVAADAAAVTLSGSQGTGTTVGAAILENLVGSIWVPMALRTPASFVPQVQPQVNASQLTIILRDNVFDKIRVTFLDTWDYSLQHVNGVYPSVGAFRNQNLRFETGAAANSNYYWQVGRSGNYIAGTVGWTLSYNRKLRRRYGLT